MKISYKDIKQEVTKDWTTMKCTIFMCIFVLFVIFSLVMIYEYYTTGNMRYLGIAIADMVIIGAWYLLLVY